MPAAARLTAVHLWTTDVGIVLWLARVEAAKSLLQREVLMRTSSLTDHFRFVLRVAGTWTYVDRTRERRGR